MLIELPPRLTGARLLHLNHKKCEACGSNRARRHSPFCSQECASTFVYYD
ncbi:hypothetical protein [Rathayibacter caricis]|jgi:hypothetical protein|nr:hypothetical protein [Rathayibacter caricis]